MEKPIARTARHVRDVSLVRMGQVAGVAALGVSALFGGLEEAPQPALPQLDPGERHEGPQLSVTVERALLFDDLRPLPDPPPGHQLLAVTAEIENLDTVPAGAISDALVLHDTSGFAPVDPKPSTALISDPGLAVELQPGVPERVVFVWTVPAEGEPAEIDLIVRDKTLVTDPVLFAGPTWLDPHPAVRVVVPLVEGET